MKNIIPLADQLRPVSLDTFEGQEHLVGKGKIIRSYIENNKLNSLIFWGPPGTGKTTLSRIIVKEMDLPAIEFSATISKLNDAREIMQQAAENKKSTGKPLVMFVDEIHHFNKSAQDAFLPYVERGDIILLGTTTENPAYKINRALLSRLKILEFKPLTDINLRNILNRSLRIAAQHYIHKGKEESSAYDHPVPESSQAVSPSVEPISEEMAPVVLSEPVENIILNYCDGDARRLLNLVEIVFNVYHPGEPLTEEMLLDIIQNKIGAYDRTGDDRYQLISAFHKSVRNSDVDASLFWLYRMMEGGEDPLFILRRMIRICVEDIGLADPQALDICLKAKEAFEFLGAPEGNLFLTQGTIYLASAPKSNSVYLTEKKMKDIVEKYKNVPIPMHIINASNFIAGRKGAGKGYLYAHDFKEKTTAMKTIPDEIIEGVPGPFYEPNDLGFEKKIKERMSYWERVKGLLSSK